MDFFDKIANKLTQLVNDAAVGTEKMAHDAQYKIKISELKSSLKDLYSKIGEDVCRQYDETGTVKIEGRLKEELDTMKETIRKIEENKSALEEIKRQEDEEKQKRDEEVKEKLDNIKDDVDKKVDDIKTDIKDAGNKVKDEIKKIN